jgi:hypothetical protein
MEHKFKDKDFGNWNCNTLILGTFNPFDGPYADYYYGRIKNGVYSNQFWPSLEKFLSSVKNQNIQIRPGSLNSKIEIMRELKFCCLDLIKSVDTDENIESDFSDHKLLKKNIKREYFTYEIISFILKNNIKKVICSWGKGTSIKLKEFRNEISYIQENCPDTLFKLYELPAFGRPLISRMELGKLIYKELNYEL